jgi:hypothetical protein
MVITFGKHKGKSAELILLKHASYVDWVLSQADASGNMKSLQRAFQCLIRRLDEKPFAYPCDGCKQEATRASFYEGNPDLCYVWCEDCDPYSSGANAGKLTVVRSSEEVVWYVKARVSKYDSDIDDGIRAYAFAKGLPKRVGEAQAAEFFSA